MAADQDQRPQSVTSDPGRRAILRALAGTPVILTAKGALAQTVSETPSMGNPRPECSNIANTPADEIPPQCTVP
jgi:hypothetical protein